MSNSFKFKKDRSLYYLHAEGITSSIENAATAYQSPALLSVGADGKDIALLNTLTNFLFALLMVKIPSVVKHADALKRAVIILSAMSVLGWLPLILVPILFKNVAIWVLVLLWVLNLVPTLMAGPLIDKWLSDLVTPSKLARYLSIRAIFTAATYISFFYMMGYLLDRFQSSLLNVFTLIFILALSGSLGSLLLFMRLRVEIPFGETGQTEFGLFNFIQESKHSNLGKFVIFTALIMFATSIVGPFFSVYLLTNLHFSYLTYTLIISVEFIARIVISYFGGQWIDQSGAIKVLRYSTIMLPFIPILWLFSASIGYLIAIQVLSGIAGATYDLSVQSYLCRDSPPETRLHFIVYQRSIITMAAAIGPLAGAYLLNYMFPIFGNPILGIFLVSGVLRLLVVIAMLPRLKTSDDFEGAEPEFQEIMGSYVIKPAFINQPYRSPEPAYKPVKSVAKKRELSAKPASPYHLEPVRTYLTKPAEIRSEEPIRKPVKENIRQDLLYRSDHKSQPPVPVAETYETPGKVHRLKDNLTRDIEYHKRWASKVPCTP